MAKTDTYSVAGATRNHIVKDGELIATAFESADGKIRAHMRAAEIVARLNDAERYLTEYEWVGKGPSVEESGGESILVRLPKGGDLVRATRSGDHWIGPLGEILEEYYHGTGWLPVGWRRMPPRDATRKA